MIGIEKIIKDWVCKIEKTKLYEDLDDEFSISYHINYYPHVIYLSIYTLYPGILVGVNDDRISDLKQMIKENDIIDREVEVAIVRIDGFIVLKNNDKEEIKNEDQ